MTGLSPGAEEGFMRFLLKNNRVLFENEMLQIGVKSEYKKNLGKCGWLCFLTSVIVSLSLSLPPFLSPLPPPPPPPPKPGRIGVFYGNKSITSLKSFTSTVTLPGRLEESLNLQAKPIDSTIY